MTSLGGHGKATILAVRINGQRLIKGDHGSAGQVERRRRERFAQRTASRLRRAEEISSPLSASRGAPGHTLQSTALVHEAYLRFIDQESFQPQNRAHFIALTARLMREILVDYARQRRAAKRDYTC
jgi:hypothetical protein